MRERGAAAGSSYARGAVTRASMGSHSCCSGHAAGAGVPSTAAQNSGVMHSGDPGVMDSTSGTVTTGAGTMGPHARWTMQTTGVPDAAAVVESGRATMRTVSSGTCGGSIPSWATGVMDACSGSPVTRMTRAAIAPGVMRAGAGGAIPGLLAAAVAPGGVAGARDAVPSGLTLLLTRNATVASGDRVAVLVDLLPPALLVVRHTGD